MTGDDVPPESPGYRRPPRSTRFAKGKSGNPRGRPRGRRSSIPYDVVLGRKVQVVDGGVERTMTAAEAFLLHLTRRGLGGDSASARAALSAIEEARASRLSKEVSIINKVVRELVTPGCPNSALRSLRMARKLDPYGPNARMVLEPWLVQAAIARLGPRRLTAQEQAIIYKVTRTPGKVKWPGWWKIRAPDVNGAWNPGRSGGAKAGE